MRYIKTKKILVLICLFVGLTALYGSICMFIDSTGKLLRMDVMLPYFKCLPFSNILFQNYIFSGISLLIVNGITYLIIKNKKSGIVFGTILGCTLMLWITIQFIIFPVNILSSIYFIIGLVQLIVGYITLVYYKQELFEFDISKYENLNNNNKDTLVVYFSRMGYTKKVAYETANKLKANILELKTNEKTSNTLGFWWCGRFGMHKWCMKTEDININLKEYKRIIIVSPIWVFSICAPIRDFCYKYSKDINDVEYIYTHFMKNKFLYVVKDMDRILNKNHKKYTSICIRFGNIKQIDIL